MANKRPGPRGFEATPEQRAAVSSMAGFGIPQEEIGKALGIDPKTLRKHFRDELDRGAIIANVKVANVLFSKATSPAMSGPSVTAAIFWMKVRAGWTEKNGIELTGKDGDPLERGVEVVFVDFPGRGDDEA